MMAGREDEDIHRFFRSNVFPDETRVNDILAALAAGDGLAVKELQAPVNLAQGQIEQVLKYLSVENPAPVIRQGRRWLRTPVPYRLDHDRIRRLTQKRALEWEEVQGYLDTGKCLMAYLGRALDDPHATRCGKCAHCTERPVVPLELDPELIRQALQFLKQSGLRIEPRILVPKGAFGTYALGGNLPQQLRAERGCVLSRWGDAGWGRLVADDKHAGRFRDELVDAAAEMILKRWRPEPRPEWVVCVPSLRHPTLVADFAKRLAQRLGLPFREAVSKAKDNPPQKLQNNSFFQCRNLDGAFEVKKTVSNTPVLLVDDVVGSRDASQGDLYFARRLGSEAAEAGAGIVSGGARGIDESAMLGALEKEGTVIGVLSDRLLKAATPSKYRPALMAQNLVLISPFSPEAGFDVGNAMARNKYVYCLADAAVVVHSGTKGGTWAGALENLKHGWVPVWVKPTEDPASGNALLVAKGARWLPIEEGRPDIRRLFEKPAQAGGPPQPGSLFDAPATPTENAVGEGQSAFEREPAAETMAPLDNAIEAAGTSTPVKAADVAGAKAGGEAHTTEGEAPEGGNDMSFYEFFLRRMESLTEKEPKTVEQLLREMDISKTQLNAWLKRAVAEKRLRKLSKPVRYARHALEAAPRQASIF